GFEKMDDPSEGVLENLGKYESGSYFFSSQKVETLIPVSVLEESNDDQPTRYRGLFTFRVSGVKYVVIEAYGRACCTGGPYSAEHLFKTSKEAGGFEEIGSRMDYPLCMELFL